ncbi:hypothetical protein M8J77_006683 [Diaphorina citri]|nr:hypothetical protein M8J77_006683 [Diaphorina citri]
MNKLPSVTQMWTNQMTLLSKSRGSQSVRSLDWIRNIHCTRPTKRIPWMEKVGFGLMLTLGSLAYPTYVIANMNEWNGRNKAIRQRQEEKMTARRRKMAAADDDDDDED